MTPPTPVKQAFPGVNWAWKLSDNGTNTQIHRPENDGKRVDFTTGKRERTLAKCRVFEN